MAVHAYGHTAHRTCTGACVHTVLHSALSTVLDTILQNSAYTTLYYIVYTTLYHTVYTKLYCTLYTAPAEFLARVRFSCCLKMEISFPSLDLLMARSSMVSGAARLMICEGDGNSEGDGDGDGDGDGGIAKMVTVMVKTR